MPDDVAAAERVEFDAGDVLQNAPDFEQAALFGSGQIDLGDITGDDHARFFAQAREKHHHLLGRGVLRLIKHDKGVGERATAHVGQRGNFDHTLLGEAGDVGGIEHVAERVVERSEVGQDLFLEITREKAEGFAGLDGGAGENDALNLVLQQCGDRGSHGEVSLARASGTDAEDHRILEDRLEVEFLAEGFWDDRLAVGGNHERRGVKSFEVGALAAGKGLQNAEEVRRADGETLAAGGVEEVKEIRGERDGFGGWALRAGGSRRGGFDFQPVFARDESNVERDLGGREILVGAGVERAQVAGAGKMEGFGVQTRRDGKWDGRVSGRTAETEDESE